MKWWHDVTALMLVAWLAVAPGWAAKPLEAGPEHGRHEHPPGKANHVERGHRDRNVPTVQPVTLPVGGYFEQRHRDAVQIVFGAQLQSGRCPPGLAKKGNGCRPPGLTKPWKLGQPLPAGVTVHPLPPELKRRLGEPPAGYRFVRIGADILLIAVGTAIVVDAIEDLAGLL